MSRACLDLPNISQVLPGKNCDEKIKKNKKLFVTELRESNLINEPAAHLLFVPVINLMDVSKDYLVFSSHVIRNTLLFHSTHVALRERRQNISTVK